MLVQKTSVYKLAVQYWKEHLNIKGFLVLSCRQFMDSLGLDPESVDNLDMYSHIPPVLMEKCAALSVRPDTVKSLIQSMQGENCIPLFLL